MNWEHSLIEKLIIAIESARGPSGRCSLALTGGKTAERFYRFAANRPDFLRCLENVDFFWGDERCVPPSHKDSNYRLAMDTLFLNGVPKGGVLYRMAADALDGVVAANRYAALMPTKLDVILLTVGEDGHVASIFSDDEAFCEVNRRVVFVREETNRKHGRLTITPPVLAAAGKVFVLAVGEKKRAIYNQMVLSEREVEHRVPASLVLGRDWIFGSDVFGF